MSTLSVFLSLPLCLALALFLVLSRARPASVRAVDDCSTLTALQLTLHCFNDTLKLKDTIVGADSQVVNIQLMPGETLRGEPGTMLYMGDAMEPGCDGCCDCPGVCFRVCAGESPVYSTYRNGSTEAGIIGLTPNYPAKIVALNIDGGSPYIIKGGAYMAELDNVNIGIQFPGFQACCCGGQGCIMQHLVSCERTSYFVFSCMPTSRLYPPAPSSSFVHIFSLL